MPINPLSPPIPVNLLPEALTALRADDLPASKERSKKHRMNRITNITTWAECFCAYIVVLSEQAPSRTQDLLAYMSLIIHAASL